MRNKTNKTDDHIFVKIKNVKIKNPIFLEGLPGIGLVGKLTADYLIKKMKMEKFAEIYSPYLPPEVNMRESGVVQPITYDLYHSRYKRVDYVILTGSVQPSDPVGQFRINKFIIDYISKFKPKIIITLGGYATGEIKKNITVYGAATNDKLVKKFKDLVTFGKSPGNIYGAAGQLLAFSTIKKIPGICLMGETHGSYVDARAAKELLTVLNKMLNLSIDLKDFDEQVKITDKIMKEVETELKKLGGALNEKPPKGNYL